MYLSANEYYKSIFGTKVYKIALNLGTTCPTRDGTKDNRGCIFCSKAGSGDFALSSIEEAKNLLSAKLKNKDVKYLAYFQSFTNTYGKTKKEEEKLVKKYYQALSHKDIVGLVIGTRPDSISPWILSEISKISEKYYVSIELGLQTSKEETAKYIRRHFSNQEYINSVNQIKKCAPNIHIVTHLIMGLPNETEEDMLNSVKFVVDAKTHGIKIALLHILKDTDLEKEYEAGKIKTMSKNEYFSLLGKILPIIPKNIVIHRLTGDGPKNLLVAPLWTSNKKDVHNSMKKFFQENNL